MFPEKRELFFDDLGFRPRGCGALCSPTPPRVTGVREGCDTLALSRGRAFEGFVFDEAGYPFEDVVSDDAGVGRSAPLQPLG